MSKFFAVLIIIMAIGALFVISCNNSVDTEVVSEPIENQNIWEWDNSKIRNELQNIYWESVGNGEDWSRSSNRALSLNTRATILIEVYKIKTGR